VSGSTDQIQNASAAVKAPADSSTALAINDVSKHFMVPKEQVSTMKELLLRPGSARSERFDVLKGIDFNVQEGEFFGVVGRNGSGKSTLLKCMAGIYQPNQGTIDFRGRMATFIELGVGFNPELNARDNILLNGTLMGLSPAAAKERIGSVLAFAELEEFADLKIRNYSSGMHVRLAFAVAVGIDADILLIDEVLAVGDLAFQQKCFDEFVRLKQQGKTVVFVTHAMDLVERFCDRAMILERGVMKDIGNPATIARRYELENMLKVPEATAEDSRHEGDEAAAILDSWFADEDGERTEQVPQNDYASFNFTCKFNKDVEQAVLGFIMHDDANRPIFATDTRIDEVETGEYKAGDTAKFSVRFRTKVERGLYFATPRVLHDPDSKLAISIDKACRLHITGPRERNRGIDLSHETTVSRG
jgi:ABC-type polysaccharide/polyol phosphate transport system ATPase subunit